MQKTKNIALYNLLNKVPKWIRMKSEFSDVVLFSRIFLFRNVEGYSFPEMGRTPDMIGLAKNVFNLLDDYNAGKENFDYFYGMDLSDVEFGALKEYLKFEESLFRTERDKIAFAVSDDLNLSLMMNADNHIAFVIDAKENSLREAYSYIYDLEEYIGKFFTYSFSGTYGYLTSSLGDTGTGLRIKFLVDLPGAIFKNKISYMEKLTGNLNMKLEEFPGYGYDPSSLFILSNRVTVGYAEDEIIDITIKALQKIVENERKYRDELFKNLRFKDKLIRNYAIYEKSLLMDDNEIYRMISLLRMAVISGFIKDMTLTDINRIFSCLGRNYIKFIYNLENGINESEIARLRKKHADKIRRIDE